MEELAKLRAASWQRTVQNSASCSGVGLHSGTDVTLRIHPASTDSGILFRRTDVAADVSGIPAQCDYIGATQLCPTLVN